MKQSDWSIKAMYILRTYKESYRQKLMLWSDGKSFVLKQARVLYALATMEMCLDHEKSREKMNPKSL